MMQPQGGAFGFSAKPQLINRPGPNAGLSGNARDPYREYVKVAPQNIMYDRRVVRGNTFAALVIPVNMQPDPMSVEKQKKAAIARHNRLQKMKEQKMHQQMQGQMDGGKGEYGDQDQYSHHQQQQQQMEMYQQQQMQMQPMHDWQELDDRYNMIDESQIEPDYYIDRPPSATYIPDEEGNDQGIQINNYDPDLFDYEMEVEPILQVLVGKSIEQARMEVIEDHENAVLALHNRKYKQAREAMLVQTQRVEARQGRRNDEIDRRNLQIRVNHTLEEGKERREIARTMSKQFLKYFKRDTLMQCKDLGLLRAKKNFSMGTHFVPALYQQIKLEMIESGDRNKLIEDCVQVGLVGRSLNHKKAIQSEMQRREDLKNEKRREEEEAARAKDRRRERRMCLKEQKRIGELQEVLMLTAIPGAEQRDYTVSMPVFDVRDYKVDSAGIYTFGGFIGELMLSLSQFNETLTTKMDMPAFQMTPEQILKFIEELLVDGYPTEICFLKLHKEVLKPDELNDSIEDKAERAGMRLANGECIAQYGMRFLLGCDIAKVGLNEEIVKDVFKALAMIHYHTPQELLPLPEDDAEGADEQREKISEQNEEIEKSNELFAKLKQYVQFVTPAVPAEGEEPEQMEPDYEAADEKCLVRIQNFRDPPQLDGLTENLAANQSTISKDHHKSMMSAAQPIDEGSIDKHSETSSQKNNKIIDSFEIEKIPQKVICLRPTNVDIFEGTLMVQHNEAVFQVRKQILEKAKNFWKDALALNINQTLGLSALKQKAIDTLFEKNCIDKLGYQLGEQYEDQNMRVTFKTFLKQDDPRLDE